MTCSNCNGLGEFPVTPAMMANMEDCIAPRYCPKCMGSGAKVRTWMWIHPNSKEWKRMMDTFDSPDEWLYLGTIRTSFLDTWRAVPYFMAQVVEDFEKGESVHVLFHGPTRTHKAVAHDSLSYIDERIGYRSVQVSRFPDLNEFILNRRGW